METWKDIPNYEGLYQVSNLGKVRSVNRIIINKNKKVKIKGRILKQKVDNKGYKRVILSKNGKTTTFLVHRLVAIVFIKKIENKNLINHLDENPSNNNANNLAWCDNSENLKYNNCMSKRKDNKKAVRKIEKNGAFLEEYESGAEASRKNKINESSIRNCCRGLTKTAGGYKWKYVD